MNLRRFSLCLGLLLMLAGCDNVRDSLGLGHAHADEFASVDRPPLSIPPDFNLRPPHSVPVTPNTGGQAAVSPQPVAPSVPPSAPAVSADAAVSPQLMNQLNGNAPAAKPSANAPTIQKDDGGWFGL